MALRSAHGTAREGGALVVVEHSPPDELPEGVPAPARPVAARDAAGRFVPGPGTRRAAAEAGRVAAERRRFAAQLADQLGMAEVGPALQPYVDAAREFADAHLADLAQSVGGGRVGPGAASLVQSAALALVASRYLYAAGSRSGCPKLLGQAAIAADKSRTALLTAHELVARDATARLETHPADAHRAFADALGVTLPTTTGGRR